MVTPDWADQQLARLYCITERKQRSLPEGSTEAGCLGEAMRQIELADIYAEKRIREK